MEKLGARRAGRSACHAKAIEQILVWSYLIAMIIPIAKIRQRAGYSTWWVLLMFVPIINIVGIWIFAFGKWRNDETRNARARVESC